MVAVPTTVLALAGARLVADQEVVVRHEVESLLEARLRDVDGLVVRSLAERQRALTAVAAELPVTEDSEELRQALRAAGAAVGHALIIDADGDIVFPPPDGPVSEDELRFLERTRSVWRGGALETAARAAGAGPASGWHGWYHDGGLQLMVWRQERGRVVALEVPRVELLADLVAELPASEASGSGSTSLVDSAGRVVYAWGGYRPDPAEPPRAQVPLTAPLAAWSLHFHAPSSALPGAVGAVTELSVIAAVAAVALVLSLLALWLYGLRSGEMRLAAQRVSFVNQVSHELKTPLTNIRLYAEMLEARLVDPAGEPADPRSTRWLEIIVSESQRLSRLITNVLTLSRHQQGRGLRINPVEDEPEDILGETLAAFEAAFSARGVVVERRRGADGTALVDRDALGQILANLLSNVEKYGASGRALSVRSHRAGDVVSVEIADRGPGIPAAERERVFEPFVRLSDRPTDGAAGTGIGLDIARRLARLHGGDLDLADTEVGACFRLTIRAPATTRAGQGAVP